MNPLCKLAGFEFSIQKFHKNMDYDHDSLALVSNAKAC